MKVGNHVEILIDVEGVCKKGDTGKVQEYPYEKEYPALVAFDKPSGKRNDYPFADGEIKAIKSPRKFYKTVVTIEILSEESLREGVSLADIQYLITDGPCSGKVTVSARQELNSAEIVKELQDQASEPEFFGLDTEGNDIN